MTIINKISSRGFKSFAEKTEIMFGERFNMIIGPNGSGKSNITDSICFVLGKSSSKEMRAEKSANLIYNGGKIKKPANEAMVIIEFDNSKKEFPVETETLTISRTVKQNGQSTYRINGEKRTRQQVVDMLRNAKIDPDGHNIILQGDIIHFMEMKPVERREIIEEISGISIYEDKKNKCLLELEKVDSKLREADIILTEREANLRELKKERDQAKRYQEIQKEIKEFKATYLHLQIKKKKEKIEDIESGIKKENHRFGSISRTIEELKDEIDVFKDKIKHINSEIEDKGEREQLELRKRYGELREEIIKINSRIEVCSSEIIKIKQRNSQLKSSVESTRKKISELNSSKSFLQKELHEELKKDDDIENKLKKFKSQHGLSEDQNKLMENIDRELNKSLNIDYEFQEKRRGIKQNIYQSEFRLDEILKKINSIEKNEGRILKEKEDELNRIKINLGKLIEKDSNISSRISDLKSKLQKLSEELARQQTRQAKISEFILADRAIKSILEMKKNIKGIYGTVSELGEVNEKYSLALEIAAGPRILSVVVENDYVAHKCIKFLKDNRLGIATFLPLNKIKELKPGGKEFLNRKGVEGRAIDLVKFNTKFKDIFSHVFGSTIIVKDINISRSIGIGTVRMVTLDGDLVERSGAMIGGFRTKRKGLGFKESDTNAKVEKLKSEISLLRAEIPELLHGRHTLEKEIEKMREEKAELEGVVIQTRKVISMEDFNKLEHYKEKYELSIEKNNKELKVVEKKIEENSVHHRDLKQKLLQLASADTDTAQYLKELERQRFETKDKVNEIKSEIKSINSQINNILEPEITRTEKILKSQEKELEMFRKESGNLQAKSGEKTKILSEVQKKESKYQINLKDLINKRHKLNSKISSREKTAGIQEEKLKLFQNRINNLSIERAKVAAEHEALDKEFEEYHDMTIKRGFGIDDLKLKIKETEKELNKIGNVNMRALEVYEELQEELHKLIEKSSKLQSEKDDVLNMMQEIENKKIKVFMKTFKTITESFKRIFNELTTKGEVNVSPEDKENPFNGGVDIQIRLTSRKFMDIRSLSGGEKTIAALAFIFAIQEHHPSPFYLLDEVDAALDKKNSETLTKMIQKYSENAQYIVISHNDNVITEADQIYGVSMQDGISKVISLKV